VALRTQEERIKEMICINNLPDHTALPYYLPTSLQIRGIHMSTTST